MRDTGRGASGVGTWFGRSKGFFRRDKFSEIEEGDNLIFEEFSASQIRQGSSLLLVLFKLTEAGSAAAAGSYILVSAFAPLWI